MTEAATEYFRLNEQYRHLPDQDSPEGQAMCDRLDKLWPQVTPEDMAEIAAQRIAQKQAAKPSGQNGGTNP